MHDVGKVIARRDEDRPFLRVARADLIDPGQDQRSGTLSALHDPVDGEVTGDARVHRELDERDRHRDLGLSGRLADEASPRLTVIIASA